MAKGNKLSTRQEMFCQEFLVDLNATQAAIRAGYSENSARALGCQNLTKINIQERIQELSAEREERVKIDADWVLKNAHEMFETTKDVGDFRSAKGFLEMCGKHVSVGAFKEHSEVEHKGNVNHNVTVTAKGKMKDFLSKISSKNDE